MHSKSRLIYVGQDCAAIEVLVSRFDWGDYAVETIGPVEQVIYGGGELVAGDASRRWTMS